MIGPTDIGHDEPPARRGEPRYVPEPPRWGPSLFAALARAWFVRRALLGHRPSEAA